MFVRTREKEDLASFQSLVAGEYVSGDRGVGMADMGDIIDVVDGGGNVERLFRARMHEW
jgi:hypothetical protein